MPITINGSGTITGISAGGLPDATITTAELASNAVTTVKITDANVTQAKLETLVVPPGVGQTMTNVAASRASGVTYTNSTGRPITVYVSAADSTNTMYVQVGAVVVYQSLSRSTYFNYLPISFIVPSGSTYVVANITYLASWVELR